MEAQSVDPARPGPMPVNLPPGHKIPAELEGVEWVELYRDEHTLILGNRPMNKADGVAIQKLVARIGNTFPVLPGEENLKSFKGDGTIITQPAGC